MYETATPYWNGQVSVLVDHREVILEPWAENENIVLMQFTGLVDRELQKIYEGDIVRFTLWWFDGEERESTLVGELVYLPESMSFGLRGVKNKDWIRHIGGEDGTEDTAAFATWNFDGADFSVIGNVYQNPELLEIHNK